MFWAIYSSTFWGYPLISHWVYVFHLSWISRIFYLSRSIATYSWGLRALTIVFIFLPYPAHSSITWIISLSGEVSVKILLRYLRMKVNLSIVILSYSLDWIISNHFRCLWRSPPLCYFSHSILIAQPSVNRESSRELYSSAPLQPMFNALERRSNVRGNPRSFALYSMQV